VGSAVLKVAEVGTVESASRFAPKRKLVVASGGMSAVCTWISIGEVATMLAAASTP
jgi:hypothetical protein